MTRRTTRAWMTATLPLMFAALLAGCASKVPLNENKPPVETRTPAQTTPPAQAQQPQSQVATVDLGAAEAKALAGLSRVIYFDFDSYVIKDEFRPTVEGFAKVLSNNRARKVVVEGHTDERGGREYNLALGQKRAEAVTRSMVLLGVQENQLEAVSFGKERPAVDGHDEAAWAKNRRAEIKDR